MFKLTEMKHAFGRLSKIMELPRADRLTPSGLSALYGTESPSWPAGVKNISSTGIYLATEKRLRTGEVINLVLLEEDGELRIEENPEKHPECRISVHARVVRQGEDGLGLSFVLPPGLDKTLWGVLVRNIALLKERSQIEEMFRIFRVILFLCHLCYSEAAESIMLMGGQLSPKRVDSLIKIAIGAEDRLASEPDFERMRAHPKLLAHLLREGSWAEEEVLLKLWTGLLVSSCSADAPDESNHILARLLGHLGEEQIKVFVIGCERALASATEGGGSGSVVIDIEEMKRITGRTDLTRAGVVMAHLYNLGLLAKLFVVRSYVVVDSYDIMPSRLGLELYRHCMGQRGKVDEELVEKAEACLLTLFEEPAPPVVEDASPDWARFNPTGGGL
jgi:hypothetical protein